MRIATFNINSIRARIDPLKQLVAKYQPDIIGLQEIKAQAHNYPKAELAGLGYNHHIHGQKSYHGVSLLAKSSLNLELPKVNFEFEQGQARLQHCTIKLASNQKLEIINGYFPQGDSKHHPIKFPYKLNFYEKFTSYIKETFSPSSLLLIMGDFNIAPRSEDIGIGEQNIKRWLSAGKCSFLPEERELLARLQAFPLYDAFRLNYPDSTDLSWFDYRSRGFEDNPKRGLRIDYALVTKPLLDKFKSARVDYHTRSMERPSDHCPVIYDFELT